MASNYNYSPLREELDKVTLFRLIFSSFVWRCSPAVYIFTLIGSYGTQSNSQIAPHPYFTSSLLMILSLLVKSPLPVVKLSAIALIFSHLLQANPLFFSNHGSFSLHQPHQLIFLEIYKKEITCFSRNCFVEKYFPPYQTHPKHLMKKFI